MIPRAMITDDDHGARVIITGGIMTSATILMTAIAMNNRWNARTMHYADGVILLFCAVQFPAQNRSIRFVAKAFSDIRCRFLRRICCFGPEWLRSWFDSWSELPFGVCETSKLALEFRIINIEADCCSSSSAVFWSSTFRMGRS